MRQTLPIRLVFMTARVLTVVASWVSIQLVAASAIAAWNETALETIRFANTPPPVASRNLAILHLAVFDAVNSLSGTHLSYRVYRNAPASALPEAAADAAANTILRFLWPQFTTTFDAVLQSHLLILPESAAKTRGVDWGRTVANALLQERDFDGANVGIDYRPSTRPGAWQPTPTLFASALLPQWPGVKPFGLLSADQFRPPPPPALTTAEWAKQFNEVKVLGLKTSSSRSAEQTEIAWFWADGVGTETPPGHWNHVAAQLVAAKNLSLVETARHYALLNLAMADAGTACWDAKYAYDWWRPITAIRAADTDGNSETLQEPGWTPLISTPPFPEHVSGHSTFSAAAAAVLTALNGSDQFTFILHSDGLFGSTRNYTRFSDAATEAGLSRIYGGIHFQAANLEGQKLGRQIGDYVVTNFLLPIAQVQITLNRLSTGIEVTWPAGARIESCEILDDAHWKPITRAPPVSFSMDPSTHFFRVVH